jgi:hypothetical protein
MKSFKRLPMVGFIAVLFFLSENLRADQQQTIRDFAEGPLKDVCHLKLSTQSESASIETIKSIMPESERFSVALATACPSLLHTSDLYVQAEAGEVIYQATVAIYVEALKQKIKWNDKKAEFDQKRIAKIAIELFRTWKNLPDPKTYLTWLWANSVLDVELALRASDRGGVMPADLLFDALRKSAREIKINTSFIKDVPGALFFHHTLLGIELADAALVSYKSVARKTSDSEREKAVRWFTTQGPFSKVQIFAVEIKDLDTKLPVFLYKKAQAIVNESRGFTIQHLATGNQKTQ